MTTPAHQPADPPVDRPQRHPLVRIPTAMLAACVIASAMVWLWGYVIGPQLPDSIDEPIGVLLLFAAAPILTALFLRGSRLWVRMVVGLASAWIWVFWLFVVLIPVTS